LSSIYVPYGFDGLNAALFRKDIVEAFSVPSRTGGGDLRALPTVQKMISGRFGARRRIEERRVKVHISVRGAIEV
jgi:hypothetical protein